ncbi:hypothetical protein DACRYDRAFT_98845 [Dacryopinax primogenitus]|uniref:Mtf2-like C-terminal domain-containing protein n=1 Tax=Dacryopinax primogenitus (strain DJM 731) TaxID=1858805 RepID=M5GCS1_DACPD|nr:uncharacterized protein DACRYDRAFT_98845 [Dacryopinax primogenitus]EJU04027.1 hypothetical protein DACRYDRAFT_98845 [Dacryopinax primogenitus]
MASPCHFIDLASPALSPTAPIFPWPNSQQPQQSTQSTPLPQAQPTTQATVTDAPAPLSPSTSKSSNPAWASLIPSASPASADRPTAALVLPSPRNHAASAAVWAKRRGEGIHKGSGFFTSQPTGFFSGLRSNRRGFATSAVLRNSGAGARKDAEPEKESVEQDQSQSDPSRPIAHTDLFKDWSDLISSAPMPTVLPSPAGERLAHRWEQSRKRQRQTLTNREKASFHDMFDLLFSAMKEDKESRRGLRSDYEEEGEDGMVPELPPMEELPGDQDQPGGSRLFSPTPRPSGRTESADYAFTAPPGLALKPTTPSNMRFLDQPSDLDRLYGSLTSFNQRMRAEQALSKKTAEEVDRKNEQLHLCATDLELLRYALDEIFPRPEDHTAPEAYPILLAGLMRLLRVKYGDPSLALAVFAYARGLSVTSYAFGCTTPAYNELLRTRWEGFRNLRATLDALEEMRLNGVACDKETRVIVEMVRREVGQGVSPEAARIVNRMEALVNESLSDQAEKKQTKEPGLALGPRALGTRDGAYSNTEARSNLLQPRRLHPGERWRPASARGKEIGSHSALSGEAAEERRPPHAFRHRHDRPRWDDWKFTKPSLALASDGEGKDVGLNQEAEQWGTPEQDREDGLGFDDIWEERIRNKRHPSGTASATGPVFTEPTRGNEQGKSSLDVFPEGAFKAPTGMASLELGKGVVSRALPEREERGVGVMTSFGEDFGEYDLPENFEEESDWDDGDIKNKEW